MDTGARLATGGVALGVAAALALTGLAVADRAQPVRRGADPVRAAVPVGPAPVVPATSSGVAPTPVVVTPFLPATVLASAIGVHAPVTPVTVGAGGALTVPDDPAVLGWWAGGALPGAAAGSVVLDGHVDAAATGAGSLFRLRDLQPGQQVVVAGPEGTLTYRVTGVREYHKGALPTAALFTRTGPPRLLLITCGGPFDTATRHYRDNIVAIAVPPAG